MTKQREVIYEKHPVSPERKAELLSKGYKIIDARFAPVDHKPADKQVDEQKRLTVPQIKEVLESKGVEIPEGVTKRDDLMALLDAASE